MINLDGALSDIPSAKNDAMLNFCYRAVSIRKSAGGVSGIVPLFIAAFNENPDDAIVAAFWLRDTRHGQGEREAFRLILSWLAQNEPKKFKAVAKIIPEYGRWDDLLIFGTNTNVTDTVVAIIRDQLKTDYAHAKTGEPVSILSKYMPSENASAPDTKILAEFWMRILTNVPLMYRNKDLSRNKRVYRKRLSVMRAAINVTERFMSAGRWDLIAYADVSYRAMSIYRKAFMRHDAARFKAYLASVDVSNDTKPITAYDAVRVLEERLAPVYAALAAGFLNVSTIATTENWMRDEARQH